VIHGGEQARLEVVLELLICSGQAAAPKRERLKQWIVLLGRRDVEDGGLSRPLDFPCANVGLDEVCSGP
jgi:hypothetical protein